VLDPRGGFFGHSREPQHRHGRGHVLAPRSRFLPDEILGLFSRVAAPHCAADAMLSRPEALVGIGARLRDMWS
jgi:hypothetical protein